MSMRRNGLTLYSSSKQIRSHYIRMISYIKDLEIEYVDVDAENMPAEFRLEINPYEKLPTVTDRDLTLFDERVISEYFDERFPHPALMPIEANLRAKIRLLFWEIEKNWYERIEALEQLRGASAKKKKLQKELLDSILSTAPLFKGGNYLINNELSLLDCYVLPALWRLGELEIELPKIASPIIRYMEFHFSKEHFRKGLSKYEEGFKPYVVV